MRLLNIRNYFLKQYKTPLKRLDKKLAAEALAVVRLEQILLVLNLLKLLKLKAVLPR
jgi:hypothetical protein